LGPNALNVTVPVGAGPPPAPVTLAVSLIEPPSVAVGVACVVIPAVGAVTTLDSLGSLHAVVAGK
jgi:hypothetical protein